MPAERPILFSDAMVRAILDGRKTQTRRVVAGPIAAAAYDVAATSEPGVWGFLTAGDHGFEEVRCPYGAPGDRLWVREAWNLGRVMLDCEGVPDDVMYWSGPLPKVDPRGSRLIDDWMVGFRATSNDDGPWRPSIHMPRWASRLTLRVVEVRVERLQAISEADARWEGVGLLLADEMPGDGRRQMTDLMRKKGRAAAFAMLWDSLAAPGATWADNPWVWVVRFEREERA